MNVLIVINWRKREMDKLTMAHEFAMKLAGLKVTNKTEDIIRLGWEYADAMQAEAKKREDTSRPDVLQDTWHEKAIEDAKKYGVGFVRVSLKDGDFIYEQLDPNLVTLSYPNVQDDWQPDWSVAPEWAVAWTIDKNAALWWSDRPSVYLDTWFIDGGVWQCCEAPSFGYQGDWRDSLRKQP